MGCSNAPKEKQNKKYAFLKKVINIIVLQKKKKNN